MNVDSEYFHLWKTFFGTSCCSTLIDVEDLFVDTFGVWK